MAGLLSVKQRKNENTDGDRKSNYIPHPNGELNKVASSPSIEGTNMVVCKVLEKR